MTRKIKTAFITGGGSGIGRALAKQLLARGATVFVTDISAEGLGTLKEEMKQYGNKLHTALLDVADRSQFHARAAEAIETMGSVDAVFNNAGVTLTTPVEKADDSDDEWLMDINFWGVVTGTKAFLGHMRERDYGHIVNVSSVLGFFAIPTQSMYCAAKHAVKGFSESLFHELQATNVQVHCVQPGGVDTGIVRHGRHLSSLDGDVTMEEIQERFSENLASTPEMAAREILTGIDKGKYHILVGSDARRMHCMYRLFPSLWRRLVGRRVKRELLGETG